MPYCMASVDYGIKASVDLRETKTESNSGRIKIIRPEAVVSID